MRGNFDTAMRYLLAPDREGGFNNDAQDPGGMTNLGVTAKQWEMWTRAPVTEHIMRNLNAVAVTPFYRQRYWDPIKADAYPSGVDHLVFDMAVNSGPGRAVKTLQGVLGVPQDGSVGMVTLGALGHRHAPDVIPAFSAARLAYLQGLDGWAHFGAGWERRVQEVAAEALRLSQAAMV